MATTVWILSKLTSVNVHFMLFLFFLCVLNYTVRQTTRHRKFVLRCIMRYKIRENKLSLPNVRYYLDIRSQALRKTTKNLGILAIAARIRNG